MTGRLLLAGGLAAVALVAALVLSRRGTATPTAARDRFAVPAQVHRPDFPRPGAPWLVVLFSSTTCDSCRGLAPTVAALESEEVATCELEWSAERALHERYGIDGVPLVLVADADGVVLASFQGTVSAGDLRAAVASVREQPAPGEDAAGA